MGEVQEEMLAKARDYARRAGAAHRAAEQQLREVAAERDLLKAEVEKYKNDHAVRAAIDSVFRC